MNLLRIILLLFACVVMPVSVFADQHEAWLGRFERSTDRFNRAVLEINNKTDRQLQFAIQAYSGSNTGGISGIAQITDKVAVFEDSQGQCLKFILTGEGINIEQNEVVLSRLPIGVSLNGSYAYVYPNGTAVQPINSVNFVAYKVFDQEQEEVFKKLVGDNYGKFINTAQLCNSTTDQNDSELHIYKFYVRGLLTISESIILVKNAAIWAAVIDKDRVLYFSNTDTEIPAAIVTWKQRFRHKPFY